MEIPFYAQETPESCVPACVRMVLAYHGLHFSEQEVYVGCETDIDGTLPSAVVRYAQRLDLTASSERLKTMDDLLHLIAKTPPIVFVNLVPLLGINAIHAVIIENIDSENERVTAIDPAYPPAGVRSWSLGLFSRAWQLARNQTIWISP